MTETALQVAIAVAVYVGVVLVLGVVATRRSSKSPEEYFMAGHGLGTAVLFMALFATNCTTFVLVGIPGQSYQHGVGVFGLNAAVVSLGIPLSFWAIGSPARRMALRLDALTPAELYAKRFGSRAVGAVLFLAFTAYTIPYMVQAVIAAGGGFAQATEGAVSAPIGGLIVLVIALVYTSLGGMRATAWTNVFQGALFVVFMITAFFCMADSLGGFREATERVARIEPDLLRRTDDWLFDPRKWASWGIVISLTVIGFPHMFARLMAARDERALQSVCRLYPLALVLLWVPAVMIGVWGAGAFPDLGKADEVFFAMARGHLPGFLGAFSFLAILAVVMSTLDAQILTLSSMLVRDAMPTRLARRNDVLAGRLFSVLIAGIVYVLSLAWSRESVFDISRKAFEGYTTLVPVLFFGVRWRRFNAIAAIASIVAGTGVLALGWAQVLPTAGFLPVFWAVVAATLIGALVAYATPAPDPACVDAAFGD